MSNMKRRFANSFSKQTITRSKKRLHGWLEKERIEAFQDEGGLHCSLLEDLAQHARIKGKLYLVQLDTLSAVLAFYERDNVILWLDDHRDNVDFSRFIQREGLLDWLPDEATEFTDLFVRTKLNYLGWPQTIHNVSDVSRTEVELPELRAGSKEYRDMIFEKEKRLASIVGKIHSPICVRTKGAFQLDFYIWTSFEGRVISIRCDINDDGSFDYKGTQLTHAVGEWWVPR